jgi:hypothetical protein
MYVNVMHKKKITGEGEKNGTRKYIVNKGGSNTKKKLKKSIN